MLFSIFYIRNMIISNSIGKSKGQDFSTASSSNVFMRSDGFRKVVKGVSACKTKIPEEMMHNKIQTSSGFTTFK